jgi:hypothetical protein
MSKGDSTRGAGSGASMGLFAVLFAAAALCFLLPFGTVSCSGDDKVTVTGVELVTRTVPGAGATQGEPTLAQQVEDDGFVPAVVALVAVLLGLALVVTRPEAIKAIGKAFLITLVGIVALLWLPGTAWSWQTSRSGPASSWRSCSSCCSPVSASSCFCDAEPTAFGRNRFFLPARCLG